MEMPGDIEVVDPARAGDLTTLYAIAPLFHQLLAYDYLAIPVKLIPYAAEALPEISSDRLTYRLRIRPGLMFAPHPAFGGKSHELTAEDFIYNLAFPGTRAVPREVVEAEGAEFARRAVGSGPYRIERFQPGTRLDLIRNPSFTPLPWSFLAAPSKRDTVETKALRGETLPLIDRIGMTRIPEPAPALLTLQRNEIDFIAVRQPNLAFDGTQLKPALQAPGIRAARGDGEGMSLLMFNMRDPVVGGFAPAQVALRRAIAMGINDEEWLRTFDQGLGTVRQHFIGPEAAGYDPAYRNPNALNPATANALLDRLGYRRGADGLRRMPDGRPLELRMPRCAYCRCPISSTSFHRGFAVTC